ncbi:MAG: DUF445 family protein [Clostridiaceae bacterium]
MENKRKADRLLGILLVAFIINVFIRIYVHKGFYTDMISFVIEAALIGGIADWFAITALFKKPLGFPWHTAIIPRNRDKVVDAIANMVENELLSEKTLKGKIKEIKIINVIINFIDNSIKEGNEIFKLVEKVGNGILNNLDADKLARVIEKGLKNSLRDIDLSIYLNNIVKFVIENGQCKNMFISMLDSLIVKAKEENTKDAIENVINKAIDDELNKATGLKRMMMELALGVARETKSVNVSEAAISIQQQLIEMLIRLKDENDPLHIEMISKIQEIVQDLTNNQKALEDMESWKQETIDKVLVYTEFREILENVIRALRYGIKAENLKSNNLLVQSGENETVQIYINNVVLTNSWIKQQLRKYWEELKDNEKAKDTIDGYIKEVIFKIIQSEHKFIGVIVKKVLNNLTDDSLNQFIEQKAGNDLHWIRINGCLVGGIFGLLVFLFINGVYLPIVTKLLSL